MGAPSRGCPGCVGTLAVPRLQQGARPKFGFGARAGVKNTDSKPDRHKLIILLQARTKPPTKQEYQKHGRARTPARTVQYRGPPLLVTKNVARPLSRLRPHGGWPASTTSAPSRRASVCLCASFCCHACCACNHSRHLTPRHPSLGSRAASAPPQPGCGGCCWRGCASSCDHGGCHDLCHSRGSA